MREEEWRRGKCNDVVTIERADLVRLGRVEEMAIPLSLRWEQLQEAAGGKLTDDMFVVVSAGDLRKLSNSVKWEMFHGKREMFHGNSESERINP